MNRRPPLTHRSDRAANDPLRWSRVLFDSHGQAVELPFSTGSTESVPNGERSPTGIGDRWSRLATVSLQIRVPMPREMPKGTRASATIGTMPHDSGAGRSGSEPELRSVTDGRHRSSVILTIELLQEFLVYGSPRQSVHPSVNCQSGAINPERILDIRRDPVATRPRI